MAEEQAEITPTSEQQSGSPSASPTKTPSRPTKEDGEGMMSILSKLIEDVNTLQSAKQSSSIKFGGLGISDLSKCSAWVKKHLPHRQYGLIMDPLLMLEHCHGQDVVAGGCLLKNMDLQFKMNIGSGTEAAALEALRFAQPIVFLGVVSPSLSCLHKAKFMYICLYLLFTFSTAFAVLSNCVCQKKRNTSILNMSCMSSHPSKILVKIVEIISPTHRLLAQPCEQ